MADTELQSAILKDALEALDSEVEAEAEAEAEGEGEGESEGEGEGGAEAGAEADDRADDAAGDDADAMEVDSGQEAAGQDGSTLASSGPAEADGQGSTGEPTSPSNRNLMLPPPNGKGFETRDAVESWLKVYCSRQGYAVSCRRCVAKGVRGWKAVFYCTRGRPGDNAREKAAKNTKKIGCPMEFNVDCLKRTDFRWIIDSSFTQPHNHGPAVKTPRPVAVFPRRRRRQPREELPQRRRTRDVLHEIPAVGKLEGRRALIAGGDPGIGRSVAVLFAREGADMTVTYLPHEQKDAERTQAMIEAEGRACLLAPVNPMDERTYQAAVDMHVNRYGMISVLVNNASKQTLCDDVTRIDLAALDTTFRTNILHMIAITKYAVPNIERGGAIINTTSTQSGRGDSSVVDYSACRGTVVAFTQSLDKQLAKKGIRVNGVSLASGVASGAVGSSRQVVLAEGSSTDLQIVDAVRRKEAARLFVFLASMESSALNGQVLSAHPEEDGDT